MKVRGALTRVGVVSLLVLAAGAAGLPLAVRAHAGPPVITNFPDPSSDGLGDAITSGPDGALWFIVDLGIGRITTAGTITRYDGPAFDIPNGDGITAGPDGALWFVNYGDESIGRITTAGTYTGYTDPDIDDTGGIDSGGITAGPDGALWFTSDNDDSIGRITTAGTVTIYRDPSIDDPFGITAGPDGALWFINGGDDSIGRVTTAGTVTHYTDPGIDDPGAITAGPDGALWFTNGGDDSIGRITTAGTVTNYTDPGIDYPDAITAGPDGALWFTNGGDDSIGRITTAGTVTNYTDPGIDYPDAITAGPDGALWFINGGDSIGRITTGSPSPPVFTADSAPGSAAVGAGYSYGFAASGSPAPTFAVASGSLPAGLSLDGSTGQLSGTPTAAGSYTFTVRATNGVAPDAVSGSITIVVAPPSPPVFTADSPPGAGTVGAGYSYEFGASGGPVPTFAVASGTLPAGLSLVASTGVLSGAPTAAGSYTFTVRATNGVAPDALSGSITIVVAPATTHAPTFTADSPPGSAAVGAGYSYGFAASGSPVPTFAVASGSLPAGLSLDTSGQLSGTPTAAGSYTFTVRATNGVAPDAVSGSVTIVVAPPSPPVFTADSPPGSAAVGAGYSYGFAASGSPVPTFAVASGSLPAGLSLDTSGQLSGTPTAAGSYTFTVRATNGVAPDAVSGSITIVVAPAPTHAPTFTADSPPGSATVGTGYSYRFAASGSPAPTFAVASGALPTGLSLDGSTGQLSGTPTTAGPSTFTVRATNGVAPDVVSGSTTITVTAAGTAPTITADTPPVTARVGTAYSYRFTATGTPAPRFTVASGHLPTGLALDPASGTLSGTPTRAGSSTFTVTARNSVAPSAVSGNLTILVTAATTPPPTTTVAFTADDPPTAASIGTHYSYTFGARGNPGPAFTVASGELPPGLALNANSGALSGTPTKAGSFTFTVLAHNTQGDATSHSITITVAKPPVFTAAQPTHPKGAPPTVTTGTPYTYTFRASGSPPPTYTVGAGRLPAGLRLNRTTGVLSGTPTKPGHYTFTVVARSGSTRTTSAPITLDVTKPAAPIFTAHDPPARASVGATYSYTFVASGPSPTFTVGSGRLPSGLHLNTTTGVLSGTLTKAGSYTFTVVAHDGNAETVSSRITITVSGFGGVKGGGL